MNKRFYLPIIAVIIPAVLVISCGSGEVAESKLERIVNPDVPPANVMKLVDGNTAFAFDLYQAVRSETGNLVYSPYSISLALAMTYGGARGDSATQMADVMHYTLREAQLHPAFNALDLDLAGRPAQATYGDESDRFQLTIANSLWGQNGWPFLPEYLDLLAVNYGARMNLVNFKKSPENARQQINNWVSDQTNDLVKDVIPQGALDIKTRLVLVNAIYFKATWMVEFDPTSTREVPFTLLNGEKVNVSMMEGAYKTEYKYASGAGWQAITLPYHGDQADMMILLPDEGNFEAFESTLTAEGYDEINSMMQWQMIELYMPKFTFETALGLKDTLIKMGMQDAFDMSLANFSGMDGQKILYLDKVFHKALIAVNEKGTEAAASTAAIAVPTSLVQEWVTVAMDRPFFFMIRDVPTGTILFMGRVVDPR